MASNVVTFAKSNWISLLVIALFLWVMLKPGGCGRTTDGPDTVRVERVVEYIPQPPVYIPMYTPSQSGSTSYPVIIPQDRQASNDLSQLTKQYNELVREYLAVKTYKDSIVLKDSTGNNVGIVNLEDQISENSIKARTPSYQLSFPHTTTTITIREPYVPKNQLFIGGGLTGNTVAPVNGVNAGLAFKNKKDRLFLANAGFQHYDNKFVPQFGISTYWKIKLKK